MTVAGRFAWVLLSPRNPKPATRNPKPRNPNSILFDSALHPLYLLTNHAFIDKNENANFKILIYSFADSRADNFFQL
jgi:hypothetical protein